MSSPLPKEQPASEQSLGALVSDMTTQISTLVRDEMLLAQAELKEKGKHAGIGIGLFSLAGLLAFYAGGVLIAMVVLALALAVDAWVSALIVGLVLLAAAGVAGLIGKGQVQNAAPAAPREAIDGIKEDIATVTGARA